MNNTRLYYLDIAKGILILLLLVSHFGIVVKESVVDVQGSYFAGIYFFHPLFTTFFMQSFFLISGYCSNFSQNARLFFYKQLKEIVVPYMFFGIINVLFQYIHNPEYHFRIVSFWFLNALLFSKVFCWMVYRLNVTAKWYYVISIGLFLFGIILNNYDIGENILSIRQGLTSCLFVVAGMSLRKNSNIYNYLIKYSWCLYIIIFAIIYALNQEFRIPIIDGLFRKFPLYKVPLVIIISVTGSFTVFQISRLIGRFSIVEYFGRNSLIIYCLHVIPFQSIVILLSHIFRPYNIITGTIFYLVALMLEMSVMVIIIKIFNYPPLKYCMGRW